LVQRKKEKRKKTRIKNKNLSLRYSKRGKTSKNMAELNEAYEREAKLRVNNQNS
jgi:hypothetical protein